MTTDEQIAKYLADRAPVTLIWNNDNGNYIWAVSVDAHPEFWLNGYKHLDGAVRYCQNHKLPFTVRKPT